ncbi:MAG: T9SS type A sorting domain-containing protein [Bacteroidia bacterium]|jgi:hypothetical protein
MKKLLFNIAAVLTTSLFIHAQTFEGAIASRALYFNATGLQDTSSLSMTPQGEVNLYAQSGSMNNTVSFEGKFYQVYNTGTELRFRKSIDGENWETPISIADNSNPQGVPGTANLTVWREDNQVKVGILYSYVYAETLAPQAKFCLSTNGGESFQNPIFISSNLNNNTTFSLITWNIDSRGDTLLAMWAIYYDDNGIADWDTWCSASTDGGTTWSTMSFVNEGLQFSAIGDCAINENGVFYAVIAECDVFGSNLELITSTDLGQNWQTYTANVTGHPLFLIPGHRVSNPQLNIEGDKILVSYTHQQFYLDEIGLAHRLDFFGDLWETYTVSDVDTLHASDAISNQAFIAEVHTALARGSNNRIYVVWSDSRDFNSPNLGSCFFNTYISWSDDEGLTWAPNYKVSLESNFDQDYNIFADLAVSSGPQGDTVLVTWNTYRYILPGCTDPLSCSYNPDATVDDNSCAYPGSPCDDGNPLTQNEVYDEECFCTGTVSQAPVNSAFRLYPNPTNGLLYIQNTTGKDLHGIEVRDLSGRLVLQTDINQTAEIINLSGLVNGYYLVQIIGNTLNETHHIQLFK